MADPLPPPLAGGRVLELAHLIAGPICGMYQVLTEAGFTRAEIESLAARRIIWITGLGEVQPAGRGAADGDPSEYNRGLGGFSP